MSSPTGTARAAQLLERLLLDDRLRSEFRAAPAETLRRRGYGELAREFAGDAQLQTLELRESRSSLAGLLASVAAEGVAALEWLSEPGHPLHGRAREVASRTLELPRVRALSERIAAGPPDVRSPATPVGADDDATATGAVDEGAVGDAAVSDAPVPVADGVASHPVSFGPVARKADEHGGTAVSASSRHGTRAPDSDHADGPPEAVGSYPGDDASKAQLAEWMGRAAERAGLPPELPVMAALQESGLRNLAGGDRDSVGFFQMRLQFWDRGRYGGYPKQPELQLRWFIDRALAERAKHPELAGDSGSYNEWVANIEQCDARYRDRYGPHLGEARRLLAGSDDAPAARPGRAHAASAEPPRGEARARTGVTPVARPSADQAADAADANRGSGERMLELARRELGERETSENDSTRIAEYRTATPGGGTGPWCAYFVSWVAKRAGVPVGDHGEGYANVDALWAWAQHAGRAVSASSHPRPGDLIVWDEHIGIVERVDGNGVIHTIEGNTSDQVARREHSVAGVVGFVRLR